MDSLAQKASSAPRHGLCTSACNSRSHGVSHQGRGPAAHSGSIPLSEVPTVDRPRLGSEQWIAIDRNDWQLHPEAFRQVNITHWGGPSGHTIDLFATKNNTLLPRYCSLDEEDRDTISHNAFSMKWDSENAWANPPWEMIPQLLAKAAVEGATMTIVTPVWKLSPWYTQLLSMVCDHPMLLEHTRELFARGGERDNGRGIFGVPPWDYTAVWRISGDGRHIQSYRDKLRNSWKTKGGPRRVSNLPLDDTFAGIIEGLRVPFKKLITISRPAEPTPQDKKGEEEERTAFWMELKPKKTMGLHWFQIGDEELPEKKRYYLHDLTVVTGSYLNRSRNYLKTRKELFKKNVGYSPGNEDTLPTTKAWVAALPDTNEEVYLVRDSESSTDSETPDNVPTGPERSNEESSAQVEWKNLELYTVSQIYGLVNGVEMQDLVVDSAASFNVISEGMLNLLKSRSPLLKIHRYKTEVAGVGRGVSTGHVFLDVTPGIQGGRTLTMKFVIVPGIGRPCLISVPGLSALKARLCFESNKFTYEGSNGERYETPMRVTYDQYTTPEKNKYSPVRIPVLIAEGQQVLKKQAVTHVNVTANYGVAEDECFLVLANPAMSERGVWCPNQLARAGKRGLWKMPLANLSTEDLRLARGQLVGWVDLDQSAMSVTPVPEAYNLEEPNGVVEVLKEALMNTRGIREAQPRNVRGEGQEEIAQLASLQMRSLEDPATPPEDQVSYESGQALLKGQEVINNAPELEHLSPKQNAQLRDMLLSHAEVFDPTIPDKPNVPYEHHMCVKEGTKPIAHAPRRQGVVKEALLCEHTNQMLKDGII